MNFDELDLADRVTLHVLPALLSAPDLRKSMSSKTIIHEARQIAETFLSTMTSKPGVQRDRQGIAF